MIVAKNGHSDHHWHAGSNLPKAPKVTTKGVFLDCLMNTPGRCPLRVRSWKSCSTVNLFLAFAWHPMSFKEKTPGVIQAMTQLVPRLLEVTMPTLPFGKLTVSLSSKMALTNRKQNHYFEWNRNLVEKLETLWWKYAWICSLFFYLSSWV